MIESLDAVPGLARPRGPYSLPKRVVPLPIGGSMSSSNLADAHGGGIV
jgi:hypothetical protein